MADKTCPKCSGEMKPAKYVAVVPALHSPLSQGQPISERAGLPVAPHVCQKCQYVELYYHEM